MIGLFSVSSMMTRNATARTTPVRCDVIKAVPIEYAHAVRGDRISNFAEAFKRAVPDSL